MSGLFGSSTLDVIFGMAFIFFLLSTICSQINELIAILWKWRAADLENAVSNLICDPKVNALFHKQQLYKALGNTDGETWLVRAADWLSVHWSRSLNRLPGIGRIASEREPTAGQPSYIPSTTFALALFNSLAPAAVGELTLGQVRDTLQQMFDESSAQLALLATFVSPARDKPELTLEEVNRGIASLLAPHVQEGLFDESGENVKTGDLQLQEVTTEAYGNLLEKIKTLTWTNEQNKKKDVQEAHKEIQLLYALLENASQHIVGDKAGNKRVSVAAFRAEWKAAFDFSSALLALTSNAAYAQDSSLNLEDIKTQLRDLVNKLQPFANDVDPAKAHQDFMMNLTNATGLAEVRKVLSDLPQDKGVYANVRKQGLAIIDGWLGDLDMALKNVEAWFDDAMERLSGLYKRRVQIWLFFIAALITLFLGVDSLRIYDSLSKDPAKRAILIEAANQAVQSGGQLGTSPTLTSTPTATPVQGASIFMSIQIADTPTSTTTATPEESSGTATASPTPSLSDQIADELTLLDSLTLPLGYEIKKPFILPDLKPSNSPLAPFGWGAQIWWAWLGWFFTQQIPAVFRHLPGLLLTIVAISLGAPFWFDALNKVASLRGSGKKPETVDGSKDDNDKGKT